MTSPLETACTPHEAGAARTLSRADYERFLPIVRRIAMRMARRVPKDVTVQDLISYGWVGLLEAYGRAPANIGDYINQNYQSRVANVNANNQATASAASAVAMAAALAF